MLSQNSIPTGTPQATDLVAGTHKLVAELEERLRAGESFDNSKLTEIADEVLSIDMPSGPRFLYWLVRESLDCERCERPVIVKGPHLTRAISHYCPTRILSRFPFPSTNTCLTLRLVILSGR